MSSTPSSLLAAGALALAVTACGTLAMSSTPPGAPSGVPEHERPNETQRGARPPVPRRNPDAVAYEITLRIEDAPGPFAVVTAGMVYDVKSQLCLPRLGGMSGTRVNASQSLPVTLQRVAPDTYRGVVYDELFVDEDYYGLGVCEWQFQGVGIGFRATGNPGETRFAVSVSRDDVVGEREMRQYFAKLFYPRAPLDDYSAFGERDAGKFRPELRAALFDMKVSIRRVAP